MLRKYCVYYHTASIYAILYLYMSRGKSLGEVTINKGDRIMEGGGGDSMAVLLAHNGYLIGMGRMVG